MSDEQTIQKDGDEGQGLIGSATPMMLKAIQFIAAYIVAHGCAPTYSELQTELGYKTKSAVSKIMDGLRDRGFIATIPFRRRCIDITAKGMALLGGNHGTEKSTP